MILTIRRRIIAVFYFIALVIQLWKPPEGVEFNFSGHIPMQENIASGLYFTK